MSGFEVVAAVVSMASSAASADQQRKTAEYQSEQERNAAAQEKAQLDAMAGQELAAGQREAEQKRRKAELMLSRAQAVAAASGGGPLDENLASGILEEGDIAAEYDKYSSTEKAKGLQYRGEVGLTTAINTGKARKYTADANANATLLGGIGKGVSMFSKFSPTDLQPNPFWTKAHSQKDEWGW